MTVSPINTAIYAGWDFSTISNDLLAELQVKYAVDFNDFATSSMGIVLLDAVAYGLDTLSFYLDRRTTEAYLSTARTPNAASKLSRSIGYKMAGAVPASVTEQINLTQSYSFSVTIPALFQFSGPGGLVYECAQDTVIPANVPASTSYLVPCYQGVTKTDNFVSTGAPAQRFNISGVTSGNYLSFGSVSVVVNGVDWTESNILTYNETNQFEVDYVSSPPTILFGDGNAGNIPVTGASITATYISTAGKSGGIAKGTLLGIVKPLVVNSTTIPLRITNPSKSSGGDDPESIASAAANAPTVLRARNAAITGPDYQGLAGSYADSRYGRVVEAQAIVSRNSASDLPLQAEINTISLAASAPVVPVNAAAADGATQVATITAQVAAIQAAETTIATAATTITTNATTASTNTSVIGGSAADITQINASMTSSLTTMSTNITALSTALTGLTTGASGSIGPDVLATLTNTTTGIPSLASRVTGLQANVTNIGGGVNTITSSTSSIFTALGTIANNATNIGTTASRGTTQSELYQVDKALSIISTSLTSISSDFVTITGLTSDVYGSITSSLAEIDAHFTEILSDESKTNLIVVSILSADSQGFYAAPSSGLVQSLQQYLNSIKEVTQTVVVVSGADFLVQAVITIRLGIVPKPVRTTSTIVSDVNSAVDTILKGRGSGVPLFLSEFNVINSIQDVAFFNVTINGYLADDNVTILTNKLDSNGNLVPGSGYTVTKADNGVSISTEFYSASTT